MGSVVVKVEIYKVRVHRFSREVKSRTFRDPDGNRGELTSQCRNGKATPRLVAIQNSMIQDVSIVGKRITYYLFMDYLFITHLFVYSLVSLVDHPSLIYFCCCFLIVE